MDVSFIESKIKTSEYLNLLWNNIKIGIIIINCDTCEIIDFNDYCLNLLKYNKAQIYKSKCFDINNGCDPTLGCPILKYAIAENKFVIDKESTVKTHNNKIISVLKTILLFKNEYDQNIAIETISDITEMKTKETELKKYSEQLTTLVEKRTEELHRSNQDLQNFAYIASHDLKAPLRAIEHSLKIIEEKYNTNEFGDEECNKFMTHAINGSKRMTNLINGLLEYSRVGKNFNAEIVDAEEVLKEVLLDLSYDIKELNAKILRTCKLPTIYIDKIQLKQVIQNLISNSLKFCQKTIPIIEISAQSNQKDNEEILIFKDNGIGIDLKRTEEVFTIFRRLNGDNFDGNGMGMSIVKRIVDQNNGKIWLKSKLGEGTTFYISLKKAKDEFWITPWGRGR